MVLGNRVKIVVRTLVILLEVRLGDRRRHWRGCSWHIDTRPSGRRIRRQRWRSSGHRRWRRYRTRRLRRNRRRRKWRAFFINYATLSMSCQCVPMRNFIGHIGIIICLVFCHLLRIRMSVVWPGLIDAASWYHWRGRGRGRRRLRRCSADCRRRKSAGNRRDRSNTPLVTRTLCR